MIALGRNAAWLLGGRLGADALNFVLFIVITRRFGPEGMGLYAYGVAIAGLVYSATTLGIEEYGIREYARHGSEQRRRLVAELLGAQACIAGAVVIVLAIYLLLTRPSPTVLTIVLTLTLYQMGSAFSGTLFVPAMATQHMAGPALTGLLSRGFAMFAVMGLILIAELPLWLALLPFAGAGVLMCALSAHSAATFGASMRPHFSLTTLRDGARTLWSFAAVNVLGQIFVRIGVIVLSLRSGNAAAGLYASGLKLVEIACLPLLFIGVAAYPRLAEGFRQSAFPRLAVQTLAIGMLLSIAAGMGFFLVMPYALVPLFGERYAGAEPIIAAMGALIFVCNLEIVLGRLLLAANRQVTRAGWLSIGACVCVCATILTVPVAGIDAAIASIVASYAFVVTMYALTLIALRRHKIPTATAIAPGAGGTR